jgi:hypothetical protein
MGNIELRWYTWEEEEYPVIPPSQIQYGRTYDKVLVTKKKLQYRKMVDVTIRAAAAGMWDAENTAKTASWKWSEWVDVPTVVGDNMFCP